MECSRGKYIIICPISIPEHPIIEFKIAAVLVKRLFMTKFTYPPILQKGEKTTCPHLPTVISHPPLTNLPTHPLKNGPAFSPRNSPKNSPKVQESNGPVHILPYAQNTSPAFTILAPITFHVLKQSSRNSHRM